MDALEKFFSSGDKHDPKISIQLYCCWDSWIQLQHLQCSISSIDMNHFSLVVFDLLEKNMYYLDNRLDSDLDYYSHLSLTLRKEMMKFLAKKHPHSKVLTKCNFFEFWLPWQSKKSDNDCGVYLMKHMECFYGENFDCGLGKTLQSRIFRAGICGQIMLSDSNANLHILKQKLTVFDKLKPKILKDMKSAKNIAAVKKGKVKQDVSR